jgi:hypothetical protein
VKTASHIVPKLQLGNAALEVRGSRTACRLA